MVVIIKRKIWNVVPCKSIDKLVFGEKRSDVRTILNEPYRSFRKTLFSKSATDAYADFHVFYNKLGILEAVEVFDNVIIKLDGAQIFPGTVMQARQYIGDFVYESGSYISKECSIALYAPDGEIIESIVVARGNYY